MRNTIFIVMLILITEMILVGYIVREIKKPEPHNTVMNADDIIGDIK